MGDKAQPEATTTNVPAGETPPAAAAPPGRAPAVTPAVPPPAAASAAPEAEPRNVSGTPTHRLLKDDEDVAAADEMVALPAKSLKQRMERYSRTQLKEKFGVESYDEVNERLEKLRTYEAEAETRRLSEMDEVTRERTLREAAEARAAQAETRYEEYRMTQAIAEVDSEVTNVLTQHFDTMWIDGMVGRLSAHLATKSESELTDVSGVVDKWCREELTRAPQYGKNFAAQQLATQDQAALQQAQLPRVAVPLTNGVSPSSAGTVLNPNAVLQKTVAPGRPNSMSREELDAYKRQRGIQW